MDSGSLLMLTEEGTKASISMIKSMVMAYNLLQMERSTVVGGS